MHLQVHTYAVFNMVPRSDKFTQNALSWHQATFCLITVTDAVYTASHMEWRDFDCNIGRKWHATIARGTNSCTCNKDWMQHEARIDSIISMEQLLTIQYIGIDSIITIHRNSYRCYLEATSEVSVTDCDGHTYANSLSDSGITISIFTFHKTLVQYMKAA